MQSLHQAPLGSVRMLTRISVTMYGPDKHGNKTEQHQHLFVE